MTLIPTWQHTKKMKSVMAVHSTFSLNWIYRTEWRHTHVHCRQNFHGTLTTLLNAVIIQNSMERYQTRKHHSSLECIFNMISDFRERERDKGNLCGTGRHSVTRIYFIYRILIQRVFTEEQQHG